MPYPIDCDAVVRRLWPYLDDVLDADERARIVAHLESCDGCRSHMAFGRAFLGAVHEAGRARPDLSDLEARVRAALTAEGFPR